MTQEHAGGPQDQSTCHNVFIECSPEGEGKCEFKAGQTCFGDVALGIYAKLARLQAQSNEMAQAPASSITMDWQPSHSARGFAAESALHSVCGWVAALIRPPAAEPDDNIHGVDDVFQINRCHIGIPGARQNILTKDEWTWLMKVRITDATGSLIVANREKAALALSGLALKDDSVHANDTTASPFLASVRVHPTMQKDVAESQDRAAEPTFLDEVLVEAEDHDIEIMPTNAMFALRPVLKSPQAQRKNSR